MAAATALLRSSASRALWSSASAVVCKPVTGTHVLRIDGYSHLRQVIGNDEHVRSSTFDVGGHSWYLRLYPNGKSSECEGKIGTFIFMARQARNPVNNGCVWANSKFSILDQLGNPGLVRETDIQSFKKGGGWGFDGFISREDLEKSEYLRDDGFAIQCEVTVTTLRQAVSDHMVFIAAAPDTKPDAATA